MRKLGCVIVIPMFVLAACGTQPRPRWACEERPRVYPSVNGFIPICPWIAEPHACTTFEDYDQNGEANLDDLVAFCRAEHDGNTLTMDTARPGDTSTWCYTCD